MTKQTLSFQAEVAQLLHLVTHSLYSNKEIFLRELISNASDACDKLRFEAINDGGLYENDSELKVKVTFDKDAKTLTITDNGIGMSAQEAIDNLGTIAKSGTKDFVSKLSGDQKTDSQLIGQFGVGFYSGFIVADKITVESRRAGMKETEGVRWVRRRCQRRRRLRGRNHHARPTRHQRDPAPARRRPGLHPAWKVKNIINKYSDHISLPIQMEKEEWKDGELINPVVTRTAAASPAAWSRPASGKPSTRPAPSGRAPRKTSAQEQYDEFYKQISHDFEAPAGPHAQPRGRQHRVHTAAVHPGQGAHGPVEPREKGRLEAVRQARLHHGRCRGPAAHLPAFRQGRGRLGRPAAEREPRAAAGKPRREGHPRRLHQTCLVHAGRPGQQRQVARGIGRRRDRRVICRRQS
jgi:HSP90 family molecular chaperone